MKKPLTEVQKRVVATIHDLTRKTGQVPTYEELRKALGLASISSVQRHIDALRKKGVITGEKHQTRGFELNIESGQTVNIPLVGNVACGVPILAVENIVAYIPYQKTLIHGDPDNYFFLKAIGDSMNISNPPINDGDYVLVKKQNSADAGQRVVALIGDEATIKKLEVKEDTIVLQPESSNQQNKPIYLFDNPLIQGVVAGVINVMKKGEA